MIALVALPIFIVLLYFLESKVKYIWVRVSSVFILVILFLAISFNWGASFDCGTKNINQERFMCFITKDLCDLSDSNEHKLLNSQLHLLKKNLPNALANDELIDLAKNLEIEKSKFYKNKIEQTGAREPSAALQAP